MPTLTRESPAPILDELGNSLTHVVKLLHEKRGSSLLMTTLERAPSSDTEQSYQIEGPRGQSLTVEFEVVALPHEQYEVTVDVEGSSTRRFTCSAPLDDGQASDPASSLRPQVTAFLFDELGDRFGPTAPSWSLPLDVTPNVPRLALTRDGTIHDLNAAACRVLECEAEDEVEPNFFSHIHGRNLRRVMWDLAQMVNQGMQQSRWLLRLRTSPGRWRWYRVAAHNHLRSTGTIQVHLRPL